MGSVGALLLLTELDLGSGLDWSVCWLPLPLDLLVGFRVLPLSSFALYLVVSTHAAGLATLFLLSQT